MATVFAVGFSDQFPCARNNFNFGIGATLFALETDANAYKGTTLYSVQEFRVDDTSVAISRQDDIQKRHAENLGCKWVKPQRS